MSVLDREYQNVSGIFVWKMPWPHPPKPSRHFCSLFHLSKLGGFVSVSVPQKPSPLVLRINLFLSLKLKKHSSVWGKWHHLQEKFFRVHCLPCPQKMRSQIAHCFCPSKYLGFSFTLTERCKKCGTPLTSGTKGGLEPNCSKRSEFSCIKDSGAQIHQVGNCITAITGTGKMVHFLSGKSAGHDLVTGGSETTTSSSFEVSVWCTCTCASTVAASSWIVGINTCDSWDSSDLVPSEQKSPGIVVVLATWCHRLAIRSTKSPLRGVVFLAFSASVFFFSWCELEVKLGKTAVKHESRRCVEIPGKNVVGSWAKMHQ